MLTYFIRTLLVLWCFATGLAFAQADDKRGFDNDHEFDGGSPISVQQLAPTQIENLALLSKVWGFLKYHHPIITTGQRQWDFELLRMIPAILSAPDREAADLALQKWIADIGAVAECTSCVRLNPVDLHTRPSLQWINDGALVSANLKAALERIYINRTVGAAQFYVALAPNVGNPDFTHEPNYKTIKFPDTGFQLLALFRFWNMVEYWAPYRDQIGEDWDGVLRQSIPRVGLAKDRASYQLEMIAVIARIHDTHANLWSSLNVRPPLGACNLPVTIRFIEDRPVVTGYADEEAGKASGLKVGDIIESFDGFAVAKLIETWRSFYAASNEPTRLRDIATSMSDGACGAAKIRVQRENGTQEISTMRLPKTKRSKLFTHDRAGDTFQLLADDIAYLKLSSIKRADISRYMAAAAATRGMIVDIRNYPSDFVPFALGQYFVEKPTEFVRFTVGDIDNPGAFHWGPPLKISPQQPHYPGKVMILIDEVSQSQSEYTAMALRAGPRARVIGSTTAGADGNLSRIPLPGGLSSAISGIGVFYPDKRVTQRVGIVPDIEVRPTIRGIRAGLDEVLEAAIAEIRRE